LEQSSEPMRAPCTNCTASIVRAGTNLIIGLIDGFLHGTCTELMLSGAGDNLELDRRFSTSTSVVARR
jgi:hypothetical protein